MSKAASLWAAVLSGLRRFGTRLVVERARIASGFVAVWILARTMLVIGRRLTFGNYSFDEGWFVWGGWSTLKGLAPYRDFHDFKPPAFFLSEAAAIACFGTEDQRFRLFFLGLATASVVAVAVGLMFRRVGAPLALGVGLLIANMYLDPTYHDTSLNDVESIGLAYYLFGVAFLMNGRGRPWAQGVGCAFLALCILTKEPFLFLAFPTWLTFLFDPSDASGGRVTRPFRSYLVSSVIGAAIPTLLILAYLAIIGGLKDYVLGYPRTRAFAETYAVVIHRFVPGTFEEERSQIWRYLSADLVNLERLGPWLPLFIAGIFSTIRKHALRVTFGIVTAFGGMYAISIGHCFWKHYFIMGFGALALLAALSAFQIGAYTRDPRALRVVGIMTVMLLFPRFHTRWDDDVHATFKPAVPGPAAVLDYITQNTRPSDYILSTAPGVYFYTKRKSALTYNSFLDDVIETFPGKTDEERIARMRAQLQKHMPKVVYIEPQYPARDTRTLAELVMPFIQDNGYTLVQPQVYQRPN